MNKLFGNKVLFFDFEEQPKVREAKARNGVIKQDSNQGNR